MPVQQPAPTTDSLIDTLRRYDEARASFPGEHWLVLAAGALLLARGGRGVFGRAVGIGAGALLVGRALTGRDGLLASLQRAVDPSSADVDEVDPVDGRSTQSLNGHLVASAAEPAPARFGGNLDAHDTAAAPAASVPEPDPQAR